MGLDTKYMTEEPLSGEPGIHHPTVLLLEAKLLELAGTAWTIHMESRCGDQECGNVA